MPRVKTGTGNTIFATPDREAPRWNASQLPHFLVFGIVYSASQEVYAAQTSTVTPALCLSLYLCAWFFSSHDKLHTHCANLLLQIIVVDNNDELAATNYHNVYLLMINVLLIQAPAQPQVTVITAQQPMQMQPMQPPNYQRMSYHCAYYD